MSKSGLLARIDDVEEEEGSDVMSTDEFMLKASNEH